MSTILEELDTFLALTAKHLSFAAFDQDIEGPVHDLWFHSMPFWEN